MAHRSKLALCLCLSLPLMMALPLSGCQTAVQSGPLITDQSYWQGMQERLKTVSKVQLIGRTNIVHKSERYSANFMYTAQSPDTFSFKLSNSLGATLFELIVRPEQSCLILENSQYYAATAEELLVKMLGMDLPVSQLHQLILGMETKTGTSTYVQGGMLYTTAIENYTVTYRNYLSLPEHNISIPNDIEISGPDTNLIIKTRSVLNIELAQ